MEEIELHVNEREFQGDLTVSSERIHELLDSLASSSSKKELMKELVDAVSSYYGYNKDLATHLSLLFPAGELIDFLESSQSQRPLVVRTNTLKTKRRELAQRLIQKGVNLDPLGDWSKVGLKIIESQVPIGATTEYLAGHYIRQAGSSFLPVMALAPKPGEKVLDLCAAPGAKTSYIGQLMKNKGVIVANEINRDRCRAIKGNCHRMGVNNIVISSLDGRFLHKKFNNFDRALVDAPCSGLGVIWKDPSVKATRTVKDIKKNAHMQKELLLAAIDSVNARSSAGFIVYSTCSVSVEENEEVIQHALKNRYVKLVDTGLEVGDPGFSKFRGKIFDARMKMCKRVYPHSYNMEGFFIAKLKKNAGGAPDGGSKPHSGEKRPKQRREKKDKEVLDDDPKSDSEEEEEVIEYTQKKNKYFDDVETQEFNEDEASSEKKKKKKMKNSWGKHMKDNLEVANEKKKIKDSRRKSKNDDYEIAEDKMNKKGSRNKQKEDEQEMNDRKKKKKGEKRMEKEEKRRKNQEDSEEEVPSKRTHKGKSEKTSKKRKIIN